MGVLDKLRGGDRRSIGRVEEVIAEVLADPSLLGELFQGMLGDDPIVRMRAADAAEKVTAHHPEYLEPYRELLLHQASAVDQQEVRWHAAQMLPRVAWSDEERSYCVQVLLRYLDDESRIVKTLAMQALADLAEQDPSLRPRVEVLLAELTETGSPAMRSRGQKLLQRMREENEMSGSLPMVALGDTGKQVSRFCLGGFHQVEISSEVVTQVVDAFLANGGNYIETARSYGGGASEVKLGRALVGRRDQVILCTKTGRRSADEARQELEQSLKALQTDYVDFCLFHGVGEGQLDEITTKGGALEGLQKAIDEGMLGALGLSSHWPPVYLEAFDRLPLSLILIWCNYLDNHNFPIIPNEVIPEARRRGIGVTAMKPLADGYLYRSVENAVRYTLGSGADVAVCGTNCVEHVEEVADAVRKGPADEALKEQILRDAVDLGQYVCRQCGQCPAALMDVFRLEGMYDRQMIDYLAHDPADYALRVRLAHWFAGRERASETFAAADHDAEALVGEARDVDCPYGIDVVRKARIATAKLTGKDARLI